MKKSLAAVAILAIALGGYAQAFSQPVSDVEDLSRPSGIEPSMLGIHWARGLNPNFLTNHTSRAPVVTKSRHRHHLHRPI
jgi:hypothetical protein